MEMPDFDDEEEGEEGEGSSISGEEDGDEEGDDESEDSVGSSSCLLYTSPSPRDLSTSRMPSSA